jgi:hypothetical protein
MYVIVYDCERLAAIMRPNSTAKVRRNGRTVANWAGRVATQPTQLRISPLQNQKSLEQEGCEFSLHSSSCSITTFNGRFIILEWWELIKPPSTCIVEGRRANSEPVEI